MLVLLASQYFFKPAPGPKPATTPKNDKAAAAQVTQAPPAAAVQAAAADVPQTAVAGSVSASEQTITTVDTDLYKIEFSNRGGVITSWVLKKYQDAEGKPLQLINPIAKDLASPFSLDLSGQNLGFDPNKVLYLPKISDGGLTVDYDYSDGKASVHKSFVFSKDSYLADVKSSVLLNGLPVPSFLTWLGGFGDQKVRTASTLQHTTFFDTAANKLVITNAGDVKGGGPQGFFDKLGTFFGTKEKPAENRTFVEASGNFMFAGLEDHFFASVALPPSKDTQLKIRTYSASLKPEGEEKEVLYPGEGISTGPTNDFTLFTGPKDVDMLTKVNPKLGQLVDWGFFGIIAKPLFLWLNWVHDHWTYNYGWAVIVVTLIINLALFPFRLSSLKSARKMQKLQPEIKKLNEKYKNLKLSDPKKAEQNQEVMALYKREGVNPVGGCLPLLVQLPFFYAFYRVLNIAIELRHAPWLWVTDLSSPETIAIHLLPLILVGTQFLSQRMTPAAGVDPAQQKMMMFMPLMFGFMFYYASAGLVLYWLTGNLVGIGQQLIINRFMPTAPVAPPEKAPVKRAVKK